MYKIRKLKGLASILLAGFMLVSVLAACGGSKDATGSTTAAGQGGSGASSTDAATLQQKEPVEMTIAWDESWADTEANKDWPTDVAKEIFSQTGVTFSINGMDDEKFKVLLAGGDLPDLLFMQNSSFQNQLVQGNQVIPLDELIKTNGPDIRNNVPERLELLKKFKSAGTGKLYFLSVNAGQGLAPNRPTFGYTVRWDYYKELGYPKFSNLSELLDICAEMQKKHPTTAEGKKVYALGFTNEWVNGTWHYNVNSYVMNYFNNSTYAFIPTANGKDSVMTENFSGDENTPYWQTMKLIYKAHAMGLLDPDSFTMKNNDYFNKVKQGIYLMDNTAQTFTGNLNNSVNADDPNSIVGFECIPVEGSSSNWDIQDSKVGWDKYWAITTNCKKPDRAMDLINYFYSADGIRTVYSGVKGVHWDVIDGKPQMKQETLEAAKDPNKGGKFGIDAFINFCGQTGGMICSDGEIADLKSLPSVRAASLTGADKDYCAYYGVEYPFQAIQNLVDQGKMKVANSALCDMPVLMATPPDDIKLIDSKLEDISVKRAPKLAFAKSDEEWEAIRKQVIDEMKAVGSEKAFTWWKNEFDRVKGLMLDN